MASFLHCPTLVTNSSFGWIAELTSISVSCFFVAGVFYTLWWTNKKLVIPTITGCIQLAVCICIKIIMGHTLIPSSHIAITVFYSLFFIMEYISKGKWTIELPTIVPQTKLRMSKIELVIRICFILLYTGTVIWSRLYINANKMNEVIVGVLLGVLFFLLVFKITPLCLNKTIITTIENDGEKNE